MKEEKIICASCKTEKLVSEMSLSRSEPNKYYQCKTCFNEYASRRRINLKVDVINLMGGKCEGCGIKHNNKNTVIFDLHHKDPSNKIASWRTVRNWTFDRIKHEAAKCSLLCSNCHRMHHERKPHPRRPKP